MPQTSASISRSGMLSTALILVAMPVCAGGPVVAGAEPAPLPPPVIAPQTADWSGPYIGLGYGKLGVSLADTLADLDIEAAAPAGFAGFNGQNGHLVYGVELSYAKTMDTTVDGVNSRGDAMVELAGRLGYAWRDAMVYARFGYAATSFDVGGSARDFDGLAYGVGFDYQISDRMALGISYTEYDLSSGGAGGALTARPHQFGLRVSMRF
jgi:outer membrane immunogenic protein